MAKRRVSQVDKWKKKKWFDIVATKIFDEKVVGDTPAEKPEQLINRVASISVYELTGDVKRQPAYINFKSVNVQGSRALTEVVGHEVKPSYLGRFVRRNTTKIFISQDVTTKDGKKARIHSVIIAYGRIPYNAARSIRIETSRLIGEFCSKKTFEEFVKDAALGNYADAIF
ncbi:MAG: 30S ribosomal protein S3ae, partial [Candidatus Iainarchaeum archaeon]